MTWKPAHLIFFGGTEAARSLTGKRVRVLQETSAKRFSGIDAPFGPSFDLKPKQMGYVGYPNRDDIVLAFTKDDAPLPGSFAVLQHWKFVSVVVNWPTFRNNFEVEMG